MITALDLGNEPKLHQDEARAVVGRPTNYVKVWQQYTVLLTRSLPDPKALWQYFTLTKVGAQRKLTIPSIFTAGIDATELESISLHYHQHTNSTWSSSQTRYWTMITSGKAAHEWLKSNHYELDLILGETGRYPFDGSAHPISPADGNLGIAP